MGLEPTFRFRFWKVGVKLGDDAEVGVEMGVS